MLLNDVLCLGASSRVPGRQLTGSLRPSQVAVVVFFIVFIVFLGGFARALLVLPTEEAVSPVGGLSSPRAHLMRSDALGSARHITGAMASPLRSLIEDDSRYQKSFQLFLERSSEHQCMQEFIRSRLPDILASVGGGKSHLNVIGVGSGAGDIDLQILSELRMKHPGATVDNEVVEPSGQQLLHYRVSVSQKQKELDYVKFTWNKMTASEFEANWKVKRTTKRADFIHMIQMLYYVKDPGATIDFFQSLLDENGKLLIILVSGESGWGKLWQTYKDQLCSKEISQCVTTGDIKSLLDSKGVSYRSHELPSQMDITECFTEGDEKGELLLDFLTEVLDFSKTASPELKAGVMECLRHPRCSVEANGRVMFNNNLGVIVLDKLSSKLFIG